MLNGRAAPWGREYRWSSGRCFARRRRRQPRAWDAGARRPAPRRRPSPTGGHGFLAALPRLYRVAPTIPTRDERHDKEVGPPRPTASKSVSSPPGRDLLASNVTDHRSKQQASEERPLLHAQGDGSGGGSTNESVAGEESLTGLPTDWNGRRPWPVLSGPHEARPHEQGGAGDGIARLCYRGATGAVDTNRAATQQRPPRGFPEPLEAGVTRRSQRPPQGRHYTRTLDHWPGAFDRRPVGRPGTCAAADQPRVETTHDQ
jgi:hypothetical protein